MALSDIAANLTATDTPWRTCQTCHALNGMTDQDAATFRALLADRTLRFTVLADALRDDPTAPTVSRDSLSRHANGQCAANEKLR
jgi:hypothetical protein